MARIEKVGAVDRSLVLRMINSTSGAPDTGATSATGGLAFRYSRIGATASVTGIAIVGLASSTSAHSDGGFIHLNDAYYRLDVPDAAFSSGAQGVLVHGAATSMVVIGEFVELVDYDPRDPVRLGLTALPNAAAEAAGGLYTRGTGAGQVNQDANGRVDSRAVIVATTAITSISFATSAISSAVFAVGAFDARAFGASALTSAAFGTGAIDARAFAQAAADLVFGSAGSTMAELAQAAPAATPNPRAALMALYMALRNKIDVTATFKEIHDDGGTVIFKKALTDDGTTYSEAEAQAGP